MSNKAQGVQTRLVQLGCLLVMLFLAIPVIPRAVAQRNGAVVDQIGNRFGSAFWDHMDGNEERNRLSVSGRSSSSRVWPRVMGEYSAGGGPASSSSIYFTRMVQAISQEHSSRRS